MVASVRLVSHTNFDIDQLLAKSIKIGRVSLPVLIDLLVIDLVIISFLLFVTKSSLAQLRLKWIGFISLYIIVLLFYPVYILFRRWFQLAQPFGSNLDQRQHVVRTCLTLSKACWLKSGLALLLWLPSIRSTPTISTIDQKSLNSKSCLWSDIASGFMLCPHRLFSRLPVLPRSQHVFLINVYRFIFFKGLTYYLYHGHSNPTVRDRRLDLMSV